MMPAVIRIDPAAQRKSVRSMTNSMTRRERTFTVCGYFARRCSSVIWLWLSASVYIVPVFLAV